ncbi:MAG: aldehyde dehydrogenase family protein, partial [Brachybacterium tyrofermentans]
MTDSIATLFIDGKWVPSSTGETRTVICPADQSEVGVVSEASAEDVDRAILAARAAFESRVWADKPASERGDFLLQVADQLQERKAEFARAEALDTGKRLVEAE